MTIFPHCAASVITLQTTIYAVRDHPFRNLGSLTKVDHEYFLYAIALFFERQPTGYDAAQQLYLNVYCYAITTSLHLPSCYGFASVFSNDILYALSCSPRPCISPSSGRCAAVIEVNKSYIPSIA